MQKLIILFGILIFPSLILSQEDSKIMKEAMQKISFLDGKWAGSGWQIGQDRQKYTFNQTEDIFFAVDGEALIVKGLGKSKVEGEDRVIHNALAVITYNAKDKDYDFRSYAAGKGAGNYKGQVIKENHFEWYMENPQSKIRFTITLNDKGQWYEIGEAKVGENWFQFFEMTLDRLDK